METKNNESQRENLFCWPFGHWLFHEREKYYQVIMYIFGEHWVRAVLFQRKASDSNPDKFLFMVFNYF